MFCADKACLSTIISRNEINLDQNISIHLNLISYLTEILDFFENISFGHKIPFAMNSSVSSFFFHKIYVVYIVVWDQTMIFCAQTTLC